MLIHTKNLKGEKTEIRVEPTDTILSIKHLLQTLQGHPVNLQRLMFTGRNLDDSKTCLDSGIVEGSTIILMVFKPKPEEQPGQPTSVVKPNSVVQPEPAVMSASVVLPAPAANLSSTAQPVSVVQPEFIVKPDSDVQPVSVVKPVHVSSNFFPRISMNEISTRIEDPETLNTKKSLAGMIEMICEMGFERKDVEAAMKAAHNDPDKAIDYLMSGIPKSSHANSLSFNEPSRQVLQETQSAQILQMIRQNPESTRLILEQIQANNPELYSMLLSNREDFVKLMQVESAPHSILTREMGGALQKPPPISTTSQLTPQENQHLRDLMELGYNRKMALEAYLACDKIYEWAANYLLENCAPAGANIGYFKEN